MSVGTLHAKVALDDPDKIYCGTRDPVQEYISITFAPGQIMLAPNFSAFLKSLSYFTDVQRHRSPYEKKADQAA